MIQKIRAQNRLNVPKIIGRGNAEFAFEKSLHGFWFMACGCRLHVHSWIGGFCVPIEWYEKIIAVRGGTILRYNLASIFAKVLIDWSQRLPITSRMNKISIFNWCWLIINRLISVINRIEHGSWNGDYKVVYDKFTSKLWSIITSTKSPYIFSTAHK